MNLSGTAQRVAKSIAIGMLAFVFAIVMVAASDQLNATWMALIAVAMLFLGIFPFFGALSQSLLAGYVATVSFGITKGLIAGHGAYYPALYLLISDIFLFALVALRMSQMVAFDGQGFGWHPIVGAAIAWLGWVWLSAMRAPVLSEGALMALNQSKFFLALWVCSDLLRSTRRWRAIFLGLGMALAAHAAMSFAQIATHGAFQIQGISGSTQRTLSYASAGLLGLVRPSGLLTHPNLLADVLVLILPPGIALAMLGGGSPIHWRRMWLALLGAGILMLLLTMSRGGWIALIASMATYLALGSRRAVVGSRQLKRAIAGAVAIACLSVVALPGVYLRLVESDDGSSRSRVLMADEALHLISENPILGVGLTGYGEAARRNISSEFGALPADYAKVLLKGRVHDKYLLVIAETGVIGLLLFLNVFRVALLSLWRASGNGDAVHRCLSLGVLSGIVGMMIAYLFEPAETGVVVEVAWIAMGAAAALSTERQAPRADSALARTAGAQIATSRMSARNSA